MVRGFDSWNVPLYKSLNSMQLRRDLFKGPTVQMEYILNKKPAGAEAVNPLLGVAVDALREKPRSKWAAASSASSSSTEGSASNSAGQNTSIALLAPGVARRHRRGWLSGSVLMLHILCVLCRLGTTAHPLLSASNIWCWRVSANAIWIWRIGPFSTGLLTVSQDPVERPEQVSMCWPPCSNCNPMVCCLAGIRPRRRPCSPKGCSFVHAAGISGRGFRWD